MKYCSTISLTPANAAAKSKLYTTLFLTVAISALSWTTAHAKVESCPRPANILTDNTTHQYKTAQPGWESNSTPRYVENLSGLSLTAVKLKIDHKTGDTVECTYDAANGEQIVFTKVTSINAQSESTDRPEIIPVDEKVWNSGAARSEVVCQPSSENACAFDHVNSLPDLDNVEMVNSMFKTAAGPEVLIKFIPGMAFQAYVCSLTNSQKIDCANDGPFYVGNAVRIQPNGYFCVEINRFSSLEWGQYYFGVGKDYTGDPMEWWGASVNPHHSLPKGITLVKTGRTPYRTRCEDLPSITDWIQKIDFN